MAENTAIDTSGSWRKAPFPTDAWEDAKSILAELEPEVEETIRQAYVGVCAHNDLIAYSQALVKSGRGSIDADIRRSASRVVEAMQVALQALDGRTQGGKI